MWTPKRVLLLALGFALLFVSYLVYAHYLGGIDGLPPLPESCLPSPVGPRLRPEPRRNFVDERLETAFGKACPEISRIIRLEIHANGIVLSTNDFHPEREGEGTHPGQVRLQPFSVALFSKKTPPGQYPEITTIRSKTAYIKFDRPIGNLNDMAKAKIVGAELQDDIHVLNNRRKPRSSNEELYLRLPKGPVFYEQQPKPAPGARPKPDVWTDDTLDLRDYQSKPMPTKITAKGMEIFFASEPAAPAANPPTAHRARSETVSGVDRINLLSSVCMELYTDSRSGFLAPGEKAAIPGPPAKPTIPAAVEKTPVMIETPGSFFYDVPKDFAQFDVPPDNGKPSPDRVHVTRVTKPGQFDQLYCERLQLQFRRKKPADGKAPSADDHAVDLEIETAHATGRDVTVVSDAETLNVEEANDFLYDARTRETIVNGAQRVVVIKDGHQLEARRLHLTEENGVQHVTAIGPGNILLLDKETKKRSTTATWTEKLVSSKAGDQDVLVLVGDTTFRDTERDQFMKADELKVWLEPAGKAPAQPSTPAATQGGSRRPQRVEATGHVATRSPEMVVPYADKLVLTFKDIPATVPLSPAATGAPSAAGQSSKPNGTEPRSTATPRGITDRATVARGANPEPDKPARPIQLSAHLVEARLLRSDGGKNELDRLWSEGQVHVVQAPEKPGEKDLDIKGETLELVKQPEGNRLVVTGDLAELQTDKLVIRGPQIDIDQAENEAWVKGNGALTMRGDNSFNGTKLDHEVDMTIYWQEYMHFKGVHVQFTGQVQAEQENARLGCISLQVDLDRPISFREGQKNGPPPKVARMVCDKSVLVEDSEYVNGRRVKFQRIECRELIVDNVEGTARGIGPGIVRIHQMGEAGSPLTPTGNAGAAQQGRAAPPKQDQQMKLTVVGFGRQMWANDKSHVVIFYEDVDVVHLATENKDFQPDLDHLPDDAVHLKCSDQLKALNRPEGGKPNQELEGIGRVVCRTKDSVAQCEKVTYHEAKDQLIFHGGDGWARMKKFNGLGNPAQEWEAKTIIHSRKTNETKSIGARNLNGTTPR